MKSRRLASSAWSVLRAACPPDSGLPEGALRFLRCAAQNSCDHCRRLGGGPPSAIAGVAPCRPNPLRPGLSQFGLRSAKRDRGSALGGRPGEASGRKFRCLASDGGLSRLFRAPWGRGGEKATGWSWEGSCSAAALAPLAGSQKLAPRAARGGDASG